MVDLRLGNCLELMKDIEDKSIDLILCDLPYGTTACKWDSVLPFKDLWEQYNRIIKDKSAIVLFASEPFATALRWSNIEMYRYDWIWDKTHCSNFQTMNFQPGRQHELICVFSKAKACYTSNNNTMIYQPQKQTRNVPVKNGGGLNTCKMLHNNNMKKISKIYTDKNPTSILKYDVVPPIKRLHPTQKPIDLLTYLVKTYSSKYGLVLDNCMGSGSTGVACVLTDRYFIGMETDEKYFEIANSRINKAKQERKMMLW